MSNNIKGITIEIGGDTTKLDKALKDVNKESRSLQSELNEVNKGLKLDPKNTELVAQKQQILKAAVAETNEKLQILKEAEKQAADQVKSGDLGEDQYRALQREIISTEQNLKNLKGQAEENQASWKKVGQSFQDAGGKISAVGDKMMVVTGAIAGIATASVAAAMDLDDGYDTILTKTGAAGDALEGLQDQMNDIFTSIPTDAETAGIAIGEVNTRFGLTGDTLETLSKQFIEFANINGADLNTSIDSVDAIMTKFGIDSKDTASVLGLMTKAGQDTGISMDTLYSALETNGGVLKEMGLGLTESVNLLAQFESSGIDSATALAALKKAQQNATADGKTMNESLSETVEKIKGASSETDALTEATKLFGKKGAVEMTQAIREGRLNLNDLSGSLGDYATTVEDTYNATLDPWDQLTIATNNLKLSGAQLAASLLTELQPVVDGAVTKVKNFTTWFGNLNDAQKQQIIKIGEIIAIIGPMLLIFAKAISFIQIIISTVGKVGSIISTIISVAAQIPTIISVISTALRGLFAILAANPIGLIIVAIVALIAIFVLLYNKCEWFRDGVNAIWAAITSGAQSVGTFLVQSFQNAAANLQIIIQSVILFFLTAWANIQATYANVTLFFTTIFTNAYLGVTGAFGMIGEWFTGKLSDIQILFSIVPSFFTGIFVSAVTGIKTAFDSVPTFFTSLWGRINALFTGAGQAVADGFSGAFKAAINSVFGTTENIVNGFVDAINGVLGVINNIPGVSIGKLDGIDLPRLAKGGVLSSGSAIVAEAGPELLSMVNGKAVVTPLTGTSKNTEAGSAAGGGFNQTNYYTSPKALSPYESARLTKIATRNMILQLQKG